MTFLRFKNKKFPGADPRGASRIRRSQIWNVHPKTFTNVRKILDPPLLSLNGCVDNILCDSYFSIMRLTYVSCYVFMIVEYLLATIY